jgi:regulatory protein
VARRKAKKATPEYLERVAIWYMERYPASEARVRRALAKRVRRSVEELETDPEVGAQAIDDVIAKLTSMGLLDDRRFAVARVRTLRIRGLSKRRIESMLRHQGVSSDVVHEVLGEAAESDDLAAARTFARKRRLGPHQRSEELRRERREKDLGKLARAGFSFGIARQVLDEELEDIEDNRW